MRTDAAASANVIAELRDQEAKAGRIRGRAAVENRVGDEAHAKLMGDAALLVKTEFLGILRSQQRNEHVDARGTDLFEVGRQAVVTARAQNDRKARWICLANPENRPHWPPPMTLPMNCSMRSRTPSTCTGSSSWLPSSSTGISLSNSGPEWEPVIAMRTG